MCVTTMFPFPHTCLRSPDLLAVCGTACTTSRSNIRELETVCPVYRAARHAVRSERWRVRSAPAHAWKTDDDLVNEFLVAFSKYEGVLGAHPWRFIYRRVASWLTGLAEADAGGGDAPRGEAQFCARATKDGRGYRFCGVHQVRLPSDAPCRVNGPALTGERCESFSYEPRGAIVDVQGEDPTALDRIVDTAPIATDLRIDRVRKLGRSLSAVDSLPPVRRDIVRRRFGLEPYAEPQVPTTIAAETGLSRTRVDDLLRRALASLRALVHGDV